MVPSSFTIIGGGLTGTAMLYQFSQMLRAKALKNVLNPKGIYIQVIERQTVFGPGFPHNQSYMMPFHLINMCASDMGIVSGGPHDFETWVRNHPDRLSDPLPEDTPVCRHYPRTVMGAYLSARFQDAVRTARAMGITMDLYPNHEATDLVETKDMVEITLKDLQSGRVFRLNSHRVLLATGHWRRKTDKTSILFSPWPATTLQRKIPAGADVAVLGTSLTAVDTVLTLAADGTFGQSPSGRLTYHPPEHPKRITLYSRTGRLPTVRGRIGPYQNRFMVPQRIHALLDPKGRLALQDLFELLNAELFEAYGKPFDWETVIHPRGTVQEQLEHNILLAEKGDGPYGDIRWQTVIQQMFPMVRRIYLSLSKHERARFDQTYNTLFFIHAAPMPLVNAQKLLALMTVGIVSVVPLAGPFRPESDLTSEGLTLLYRAPDAKVKRAFHPYGVDARGQDRFYDKNPDPLAKRLLNSGTVEIEPANSKGAGSGSLWVDPRTHRVKRRVRDKTVHRSECIYAVGAMTRGQIIDASMAYGSAISTGTIAQDWIGQIGG